MKSRPDQVQQMVPCMGAVGKPGACTLFFMEQPVSGDTVSSVSSRGASSVAARLDMSDGQSLPPNGDGSPSKTPSEVIRSRPKDRTDHRHRFPRASRPTGHRRVAGRLLDRVTAGYVLSSVGHIGGNAVGEGATRRARGHQALGMFPSVAGPGLRFKTAGMQRTCGAGPTIRLGNTDVLFASHVIAVLQGPCLIPGDGARNASTAP